MALRLASGKQTINLEFKMPILATKPNVRNKWEPKAIWFYVKHQQKAINAIEPILKSVKKVFTAFRKAFRGVPTKWASPTIQLFFIEIEV